MGAVPTWYRTLKAAQYLRVAPWELAAQPVFWLNAAETAQEVEDNDRKAREAKTARLGKAG